MLPRITFVPVVVLTLLVATTAQAAAPYTPLPVPNLQLTFADPAFTALPGARALFGPYEGGVYRIEVPANWNGNVFLYDHGYQGGSSPNAPFPGTSGGNNIAGAFPSPTAGSLREHLINKGIAWGSTSYRSTRWIPAVAAQDTVLLRDLFIKLVGVPRHTYLYATPMGGNVVTLSLENFPELYDGAVTECGVTAGVDLMDYFTATTLLAEYFAGVDARTVTSTEFLNTVLPAAIGRPGALTQKGKQMQSIMVNLTGGRRPFDTEGLAISSSLGASVGLTDLNNDVPGFGATASPLYAAAGNSAINYHIDPGLGLTDAAINSGVRRKAADAQLRSPNGPYIDLRPLTGAIKRPLISLHTTGDYTVPITIEQTYRRAVEKAGSGDLLVQRLMRNAGHCTFSVPEQSQAVDDLVRWVELGFKPEGDDLFADLTDSGKKFTNPIRPGDPGHALDPAGPAPAAAAQPASAIRPPSTGDGGLVPGAGE